MPGTRTSELIEMLADECAMLELLPVDGGVFAPSSRELAEDLLGLAAALAQITSRAAVQLGVALPEYPAVSVLSQPAWASGEPGLVLRMMTMSRSEHDLAWDAASQLDLPGAISAIADDLRVLEAPDGACHYAAVHHLVETAQHVCSTLHVLAGLVGGAAKSRMEP